MNSSPTSAKGARKRIRKGQRAGAWVTARKGVQILTLLLILGIFLWSRQGGLAGDILNIPMRLDPLLMLEHVFASRAILATSALALLVLLLSLVFGRAWCGWICPLGTVLDLVPLQSGRKKRPAPAEGWRTVKYVLLLASLTAALLGNLTLLFLDPLTIFLRTLTVSLWPAVDRIVTAVEALLYPLPAFAGPVSAVDALLRPALLPVQPLYYRDTLLFATLFLVVIALNGFAERFWCRYLCPLGGLLGLFSKLAIFRRRVGEECKGCVLCTDVCPTGTIDPSQGYRSDPGECTLCMNCVEACPRGLSTFQPRLSLVARAPYDPGRREVLGAIGAAVIGVSLFQSDSLTMRESPFLLRPPGGRENNPDVVAYTQCVRCGECLRVCPTGGLQPAVFEAGLEGFGTPVLVPRLGFCDYACTACGQACPVQAIPQLSLEKKRQQVVGRAYINENRCIPWSDHRPCIVCEEMCPVPDKAIQLETAVVWAPNGKQVTVKLPHVLRDQCIGCGICEYQCPVGGEAAIRVYNPLVGSLT
jgi:polyferredoxin